MLYNLRDFDVVGEGSRTPCIAFGKGDRPLVILPGLRFSSIKGSGHVLAYYYRLFAREYRVWVIDRKDPVLPGCTIHDLAEDTAETMGRLGIEKADMIGASQGGMIAQDLAIRHPELVSRLVLAVTCSRTNDTVRSAVGGWIEMVRRGDYAAAAKDYMLRGYSEKYLKRYGFLLPLAVKLQPTMPPERFIALAGACLTWDAYDALEQIRCPVLVLGGGKDRVVTGEASCEIADKLGCRSYIYEELSHEAYNEAKDFNRRIYDFLKE